MPKKIIYILSMLVFTLFSSELLAQVNASSSRLDIITVNYEADKKREVYVHVPQNLSPNPGIVLVFHGGGGSAKRMYGKNSIKTIADEQGFLAVYPDSGGEKWNDGRSSTATGGDDIGYVKNIISELNKKYNADPSRVFSTGMSNGAHFTFNLACKTENLIKAYATVGIGLSEALHDTCMPSSNTPMVIFHGTKDPFAPYYGGRPKSSALIEKFQGPITRTMLPAEENLKYWANINGCHEEPNERNLPDRFDDGTTVTLLNYDGCQGGDVMLFRVNNGGHTWPNSSQEERRITGKTTKDIDASRVIIEFFQKYGL